jgi:hypothetical protein
LGTTFIQVDNSNTRINLNTEDLQFNGAALQDPTPGVVATKAMLITLNGTQYKINLY